MIISEEILDVAEINWQHFLGGGKARKCWSNHLVLVSGKLVLQKTKNNKHIDVDYTSDNKLQGRDRIGSTKWIHVLFF